VAHVPAPWLSPLAITPALLGLPERVKACLFDLDGVLTDSGLLHARAWGDVFDAFLQRLNEKTGWRYIPFTLDEYRAYLDGRPRLEGIHLFLHARGIRVPEGSPDDSGAADTAYGLARRKSELLAQELRHRGTTALPGARRYLRAAGGAGLGRAVISASASTDLLVRLAHLEPLVDVRLDADAMRTARLRPRPSPDTVLEACRLLGVEPRDAVAVTSGVTGFASARSAGVEVIMVASEADRELLHGLGAERIVPSLAALLDPRIAPAA
jgi:beta-phosphoglucomutase-like phosphatase (HAD superfamily)